MGCPSAPGVGQRRQASKRRLALESGHELILPRLKGAVIDEDVESVRLLNLDPGRKSLQPTDAWTPFASDEHAITQLHLLVSQSVPVPLFRVPCF